MRELIEIEAEMMKSVFNIKKLNSLVRELSVIYQDRMTLEVKKQIVEKEKLNGLISLERARVKVETNNSLKILNLLNTCNGLSGAVQRNTGAFQ